ncbi:hypothetical protein KBI23_09460 [bacterium]|nr:hypothetical protein [bacterium]MBP9810521.1 hypothetical protein [bacterium]
MPAYIVRNPSSITLDKLYQAGIDWLNWEPGAILLNEDIKLLGRILEASTFEAKPTEWEDLFEVTFTFPSKQDLKPPQQSLPYSSDSPLGRSRANYIKLAEVRYKEITKAAQASFDATQANLGESLASYLQSASLTQIHLKKPDIDQLMLRFKEQYRQLLSIPQVEAVRFHPGQIFVYTRSLQATGSFCHGAHELGKFLIVINPADPSGNFIACFNLAGQLSAARGEMHAPYVYGDGRICPNEILESLLELVAQMEYATAIEVVLQFLETAGDDAMGRYLLRWPQAASNLASKTNSNSNQLAIQPL